MLIEKNLYWGIFSKDEIIEYKPNSKKSILIRALEPSYKTKIPYKIKYINEYIDVLELYFEDIWDEKYINKFILFDENMLSRVKNFLLKNNGFDEIIVHCAGGVSRSSALMVILSRILSQKNIEDEIFSCRRYNPNPLLLKVYDKDIDKMYLSDYSSFKPINVNELKAAHEVLDVLL